MRKSLRSRIEGFIRQAVIVAAVAAAGPASLSAGAEYRAGQLAMGTVLNVTVIAEDGAAAERLARAAIAEARRWDEVLTTWRPEGELARLNASAGHGPAPVSRDLESGLRRMQVLVAETGGAFDPGVGALVDLWRSPTPPLAERLLAIPPPSLATALSMSAGHATLREGTAIDAGGIGKGMALDAVAGILRRGGARAAFADFGGSSQLALGAPEDDAGGWKVVVSGYTAGTVRGVVRLRDASLSTSRASGPGETAGAIVDPRSRRPVSARRSVTVRAADAASADAWSTALVILGREGLDRARAAGIEVLIDEDGETVSTDGFWRVLLP